MVYPSDSVEQLTGDLNDEDKQDDAVDEDEDNMLDAHVMLEGDDVEGLDSGSRALHMSMIVSAVDGAQWKEETERVAARLNAGRAESLRKNLSGWATHVQQMQQHASAVLACALDSEADGRVSDDESITTLLQKVQRNVLEGISGIARSESVLNSKPLFVNLSVEYAKIKQEMDRLDILSGLEGRNTSALTDRLAEVQEQVEEALARLAEKTGQGDGDEDGGGAVMNLRRAIKRIKGETVDMELQTAMLQTRLWTCRKEQVALSRKRRNVQGRSKKFAPSASRRREPHDDAEN